MRQASPKRAKLQRERRALIVAHVGFIPVRCTWPGGCVNEACDPHEPLTRARGGSIVDLDNIVLLCRDHHDWIDQHPTEATALGMLVSQHHRSENVAESCTVPDMAERRPISMRISDSADQWVTDTATQLDTSRAVVLRAMLGVAAAHPREVAARVAAIKDTA